MNILYKRQAVGLASFFILSIFFLFFAGCSRSPVKAPVIDAELAYSLALKLASHGSRPSGSAALLKQAEFIKSKAVEFGAKSDIIAFSDNTPDGLVKFYNVEARISGKVDEFIVIGCHYDTKKLLSIPDFSGANDGASGAALLLSMIKAAAAHKPQPYYSLRFVFFDGEECINNYSEHDGLHGSRFYAEQLKKHNMVEKCRAVIIADMIGDKDLQIAIPTDSDPLLGKAIIQSAAKLKYESFFTPGRQEMIDDHTPFQKIGIPAIDVIDFNYGPGNSWWHTSEDTIDKLDKHSFKVVGDVILDMVWQMPEK